MRDVIVRWQGQEATLVPSFRFLRRLDARLRTDPDRKSSMPQCAQTLLLGGDALMDIPIVFSAFLAEAGITASEEDCWALVSTISSGGGDEEQRLTYSALAAAVIESVIPGVDLGKNPEALPETATAQG